MGAVLCHFKITGSCFFERMSLRLCYKTCLNYVFLDYKQQKQLKLKFETTWLKTETYSGKQSLQIIILVRKLQIVHNS